MSEPELIQVAAPLGTLLYQIGIGIGTTLGGGGFLAGVIKFTRYLTNMERSVVTTQTSIASFRLATEEKLDTLTRETKKTNGHVAQHGRNFAVLASGCPEARKALKAAEVAED